MNKKYIVRLSDAERRACEEMVKKLKGASQKVRRARVLLKADGDGPKWTHETIGEAYGCRGWPGQFMTGRVDSAPECLVVRSR